MAMSRVFFSDLKSGRCSSTVEVHLLRFWEARNPRRGGELMWIDILMVDVNATINASRVGTFRPKLAVGSMYSLSGFDVGRCGPNFLDLSSVYIRPWHPMVSISRLPGTC
ncbi:unnamed protein product [Eruca vesicaria subsp. sativa]|uniref:Uncharacterized protein n=1 Tax=Eruca vesicaria subsp. sativa TaxID=29727 RepID=A0ABC8JZ30_ERUVS|nr:unnamed protein product [Eruca vesicaria subsp. sativa]